MDRLYQIEKLVKWLYCQMKANNSNSSPQVIVTDAESYQIIPNSSPIFLTLTGTRTDVELPPLEGNIGLIIFIKNAGTEESKVWTDSNDIQMIWEGGMDAESTMVPPGSVMRIYNDGLQFSVL